MNSIVAGIMGLTEDDSVPVPIVRRSGPKRSREGMRPARRRMVSAIMGMSEADEDETVIPDDAEDIKNVMGPSGIKMDGDAVEKDREPDDPEIPNYGDGEKEMLMSPAVALVAPDVTPQALEPLDPSQVPQPPVTPHQNVTPGEDADVDHDAALRVLLGKGPKEKDNLPPVAPPITAEAAQASVNASLGVTNNGGGLNRGPMPEPEPSKPEKIMEAFYRYGGNVRNTW